MRPLSVHPPPTLRPLSVHYPSTVRPPSVHCPSTLRPLSVHHPRSVPAAPRRRCGAQVTTSDGESTPVTRTPRGDVSFPAARCVTGSSRRAPGQPDEDKVTITRMTDITVWIVRGCKRRYTRNLLYRKGSTNSTNPEYRHVCAPNVKSILETSLIRHDTRY